MRVCFTGDAKVGGERVDRKHLEDAAKRFGLVPTGAVSGRTDVLICPDDYDEGRSKFVKALKLGVRLMTVAEFVTQIPLEEG
jgi:NAD-dependent DNA ligase